VCDPYVSMLLLQLQNVTLLDAAKFEIKASSGLIEKHQA
jgi:hypothetical protein